MALSAIPSSGLTLHVSSHTDTDSKHATSSNPAILFRLSDDLLQDVKKAQDGLHFLTGSTPKIRLGNRTIDLTISNEDFRHELYSASADSLGILDFAGIVGHRAELKVPERKQSVGGDAALAALQSSMDSLKQEKQAKSVNISHDVVKEHRNRWEAAREQKQAQRRGLLSSHPDSPSLGSSKPTSVISSTSFPTSDSAARIQAMRTPLVHLLAMRPLTFDEIAGRTHIPKDDLDEVLRKIGKQQQGKWQLTDKAFKELDVYKFGYSTQEDRQAAVENAVRAYDRLRLGKEEKLWQMLLPVEDRDQGKYLSRLHLGPGVAKLTPNPAASPLPPSDGAGDTKSVANTPRLGPSSTPKVGPGKSDSAAMSKRLFAKDPKKARLQEEAKERKRKEREAAAAASDKEGSGKQPATKKQTTKTNNPKVKSAEIVQNSSEESEGEIKEGGGQSKTATNDRKPAAAAKASSSAASNALAAARPKMTKQPASNRSQDVNGDVPTNASSNTKTKAARPKATPASATLKSATHSTTKPKTNPAAASKTAKPAALGKGTAGLSAPSSQPQRSQLSPNKPDSRPTIPSPLGAARPRVASDVSDRGAIGVQRVRQGAETPKGLGITNGVRKRQDTVTSAGSYTPGSGADKMNGDHHNKPRNPAVSGTSSAKKTSLTNGSGHRDRDDHGQKRKAVDSPSNHDSGPPTKHRKTESTTSSQSQKSSASSVGAASSTGSGLHRSNSSDSSSSIINDITYSQGVNIAQKFRDVYYPNYAKLYDEQLAMEKRGETVPREERRRLWDMHRRLEQMKREIKAASDREHLDEG